MKDKITINSNDAKIILFVEQIVEWHQTRISNIQQVIDSDEYGIKTVDPETGDDVLIIEAESKEAKYFKYGLMVALDIFGELPFSHNIVSVDEEQ